MISESVRRNSFWVQDALKKNAVKKQYQDLKYTDQHLEACRDQLQLRLHHMLAFASTHTPFYADRNDFTDITDFPVINKNTIKNHYSHLRSIPFQNVKLHPMSTSGSTGTPFTIMQNMEKRNRVLAEVIHYGEKCGYQLGDRFMYIRAWPAKNQRKIWDAWKKNVIMVDSTRLDEEYLEAICLRLKKDKSLKCILAYGSTLSVLARYLVNQKDTPDRFHLTTIISHGEALPESARQNLEKVFACTIVSRYSNQENGILAQETVQGDYFDINQADYYIEFLKRSENLPASPGETARIVATDLYNYAMPLIRYDTGDLAVYRKHPSKGSVIERIDGKSIDLIYDTRGNLFSSVTIGARVRESWHGFNQVKQYQLIQEGEKEYRLKINYDSTEADNRLIQILQKILGNDATVHLEHVTGIPVLASGKFQYVKCNYKKEDASSWAIQGESSSEERPVDDC